MSRPRRHHIIAKKIASTFRCHASSIGWFIWRCNRRDGIVVRAFALYSADLGFIPKSSHTIRLFKNGIHSFPAWRSAHRDSVENKPANLLVVSLGKALNGTPPSSCGRQVVGPSSLPVVVAQSDERYANRVRVYLQKNRCDFRRCYEVMSFLV